MPKVRTIAVFEAGSCPPWPTAGPAVAEEMEAGADALSAISSVLGVGGPSG